MRRVESADWQPTGVDRFEQNAWHALRHEGSSCVVAGPGAGKTEFLAQRADYLFSTRTVSQVPVTVEGAPITIWKFDDQHLEVRYVAQWISADAASSSRSPDCHALLTRQKTADLQPLFESELARLGMRLRNDNGIVGSLRLQDLLADEFAMRIFDFIRLSANHGRNGDAWLRVSDLISGMHDWSRDDETHT